MAAPELAVVTQRLQTRAGTLECAVAGEGAPATLLFNGAGMTIASWGNVWDDLARMGRVLAWNRLGIEGSGDARDGQSGAVTIASLRELLTYAGVVPPYVLAGHSLGALHATLFARLYPAETAGLLLVEPLRGDRVDEAREREPEFRRSLAKVQGTSQDAIADNLRAELQAADRLLEEIDAAGAMPDVPAETIVAAQGGHFPQIDEPDRVVEALARLRGKIARLGYR